MIRATGVTASINNCSWLTGWFKAYLRGSRPLAGHFSFLFPMKRGTCVPVDREALMKALKLRKINTTILAALAGYSDRTSLHYYLSQNKLPAKVIDVLDQLGIDL